MKKFTLATRFRGLLPVVVDVETTGVNPATDGLLEIAAIPLKMDEEGRFVRDEIYFYSVEPFVGAHIDSEALSITGIDPYAPLRYAMTEQHALHVVFNQIKEKITRAQCQRAVLVGHNAWFDLAFIQAAAKRCCLLSHNPFHLFTTFDTATLAGAALGETVLARAMKVAKIPFDIKQAHSAAYDAEKTAELFCYILNSYFKDRFF